MNNTTQPIQHEEEVQVIETDAEFGAVRTEVAHANVVPLVPPSQFRAHSDTASASGTHRTCSQNASTVVDFHGFSVQSKYVKYLESIYRKEGEFWSTCIFQGQEYISFILDRLGRTLMMIDVPWSSITPGQLREVLQWIEDHMAARLKLDCFSDFISKAKTFLSMEEDKARLEAERKEIMENISSLQSQLKLEHSRKIEVEKQLEAISKLDYNNSSALSDIVD